MMLKSEMHEAAKSVRRCELKEKLESIYLSFSFNFTLAHFRIDKRKGNCLMRSQAVSNPFN